MKELKYKVTFLTPAFLGNAEQSAQWRTPPFKALLRQWWRVVYAADHGFKVDIETMRREEGVLFGNAWLENAFCKSLLRLRLDTWRPGTLENWSPLATVKHPEVKFPVGSDLYMGYGPLTLPRGGRQPEIKSHAAIQAGDNTVLALALPTKHKDPVIQNLLIENGTRVERALWLMHRYGTLGGRSRNGWGSLDLLPLPPGEGWGEGVKKEHPMQRWNAALDLDWPHALGEDDTGALIWQTEAFSDWKVLMKRMAEIKIGLRTQFSFTTGKNAAVPEARHWLSYPVTNHSVRPWGNNARLPNTLRFKVRSTAEGKLVGVIFHVPHMPPRDFRPDTKAIEDVWRKVHQYLDAPAQKLKRIKE